MRLPNREKEAGIRQAEDVTFEPMCMEFMTGECFQPLKETGIFNLGFE